MSARRGRSTRPARHRGYPPIGVKERGSSPSSAERPQHIGFRIMHAQARGEQFGSDAVVVEHALPDAEGAHRYRLRESVE